VEKKEREKEDLIHFTGEMQRIQGYPKYHELK
jgi:hypothetical protein